MNQQDPYCFWLSTSMNRNIKPVSETVKLNFKPGHQISEMSQMFFFAMLVFFHVQNYVSVASAHDKEM